MKYRRDILALNAFPLRIVLSKPACLDNQRGSCETNVHRQPNDSRSCRSMRYDAHLASIHGQRIAFVRYHRGRNPKFRPYARPKAFPYWHKLNWASFWNCWRNIKFIRVKIFAPPFECLSWLTSRSESLPQTAVVFMISQDDTTESW